MESTKHRHINVVAGLIVGHDRVLACQRHAKVAFPLKWEFPGGKVEGAESDIEALRRELKEELGIIVRAEVQVFQHEHTYIGGPKVSLRFYRVLAYDGEVKNCVFQRIEWVELSKLGRLDFLAGDRPLIDRLVADGGAALLR